MALRPTPETKLISALLTLRQPSAGIACGITPEMFSGFRNEYEWLLKFHRGHASSPSVSTFKDAFPDFPYSETEDLEYHASVLMEEHTKKTLISTLRVTASQVQEGDLDEAIMTIKSFEAPKVRKRLVNRINDQTILDIYADPPRRTKTPWKTLTFATHGGYAPGELWLVAARFGSGKSWFLQKFACDALLAGKRVLYYSLEMPAAQVQTRFNVLLGAALGLDVTHDSLETRTMPVGEYKSILDKIAKDVPGELYIVDPSDGPVTPETVRQQSSGMDLVIVDYIGLMSLPGKTITEQDWVMMGRISNELKQIAVANEIPIIAAAQINRQGEFSSKRPPDASHLARADALGQDADLVLTHAHQSTSVMGFNISKNRSGPSKILFWSRFLPNTGEFNEISSAEAQNLRDTEDFME